MNTTTLNTTDQLADEILARKAEIAQAEKALKALSNDLLKLAPVGTQILRPNGKVTVAQRTYLVADVDVLRGVASRAAFKALTKVSFDAESFRALDQLDRVTDKVREVVQSKDGDPYLVTTVAKR